MIPDVIEPDHGQARDRRSRACFVEPRSLGARLRSGVRARCPACDGGPLFQGFLKVVARCEACGFDFGRVNTGDGAAVFIMQIAGAAVVFPALYVQIVHSPPIWAMLAVTLPLTAGLALGLMRPGKGVMIALQTADAVRQDGHD